MTTTTQTTKPGEPVRPPVGQLDERTDSLEVIDDSGVRDTISAAITSLREYVQACASAAGANSASEGARVVWALRDAIGHVWTSREDASWDWEPVVSLLNDDSVMHKPESLITRSKIVRASNAQLLYEGRHAAARATAAAASLVAAAASAEGTVQAIEEAAGKVSTSSLSTDFAEFARTELWQANLFRYLTVSTLGIAFGVVIWIGATESSLS